MVYDFNANTKVTKKISSYSKYNTSLKTIYIYTRITTIVLHISSLIMVLRYYIDNKYI